MSLQKNGGEFGHRADTYRGKSMWSTQGEYNKKMIGDWSDISISQEANPVNT